MTNIETYKQFIEGYTAGIRRIGPQRPLPGPGRPGKPIGPKPKPKPKPEKDKPIFGDKVNERGGGVQEDDFDAARRYVKELADYLEIPEKDLADIIYNGWMNLKPEEGEETIIHDTETGEERTRTGLGNDEKLYSLMYSYGLI